MKQKSPTPPDHHIKDMIHALNLNHKRSHPRVPAMIRELNEMGVEVQLNAVANEYVRKA